MNNHKQQGMTLLELMLVLTIVGILVALAAPSFQRNLKETNLQRVAISFANAISIARSEAIARNEPVMVVPNNSLHHIPGTGEYRGGVWSVELASGQQAFLGDTDIPHPSLIPTIEVYQNEPIDEVSTTANPIFNGAIIFDERGTIRVNPPVRFCYDSLAFCSQVKVSLAGIVKLSKVEK